MIALCKTLVPVGKHKDFQGRQTFQPFSGPALGPVQKKLASSILLFSQRLHTFHESRRELS